jgi:urease accessory protein UreF
MELLELLETARSELVGAAAEALAHARLTHYELDADQTRERLATLYDLTVECVRQRNLDPMTKHAHELARDRHRMGYDLHEVQTAFNVLEEVIWKRITAELTPQQYPEAFGLTSTVLGAGKEALAVEYVTLAGRGRKPETLDLSALFTSTY